MFPAIDEIRQRARALSRRIVYTNPADVRVLEAAGTISQLEIAHPILLGDLVWIERELRIRRIARGDIEVVEPAPATTRKYVEILLEDFRAQGVRAVELEEKLGDPIEYATAMVLAGDADGLVAGPGSGKESRGLRQTRALNVSGMSSAWRCFLVIRPPGGQSKALLFADGLNMATPAGHELAEIALEASRCGRNLFGYEPRVGFIAPSVVASLKRPNRFESAGDTLGGRVEEAIATLKARDSDLAVDRQLHSWVPSDGLSNTYVFADSQPGNLQYDLEKSFGASRVIGPLLQGLDTPANELGAGCTVEDVIDISAITILV